MHKPMWEVFVKENICRKSFSIIIIPSDSKKTLLLWRFHHTFSDAHGITGMLICMADNYSSLLFGPKKSIKWRDYLFAAVASVYYSIKQHWRIHHGLQQNLAPTPLSLRENKHCGVKKCAITKSYPLEPFKKIAHSIGLKLNPLFTAIIASALKKTCEHYGDKQA